MALEEIEQCIPKNKREKQCLRECKDDIQCTMQHVTCLLRKNERVCKVKNHCKLEFFLTFFYSPSSLHTHTLPIMQMTCNRE